ncbi:hypothetical protein LOTGIDRAFT_152547 [Lottia gigantea]|uniref:Uncharacterized protein n=1 Tax=Lottia gigantea TaxID=225164 RepID=V4CSY9_LOTGI|nr:hypothetical protein LOTGIDRAFT_152547 [Lottia gigantea]ESP05680.1 hypothetical protein LOTGIDRAFT_152547 [Lottia gigantea]
MESSKTNTIATLLDQYRITEFCLKRAWDQVILLQNRLFDLKIRYDRAKSSGQRAYQYSFKQRKTIIEKTLKMYATYTEFKADNLFQLRIWLMMLDYNFEAEEVEYDEVDEDEEYEDMVEHEYMFVEDDYYIDDDELVTAL